MPDTYMAHGPPLIESVSMIKIDLNFELLRALHVFLCRRITEYMNDKVTHVLTQENWDDNFDQVRIRNAQLCL